MNKRASLIALFASCGLLASCLLALASSSDGLYSGIPHIGGIAYLLPVLGLCGLAMAMLAWNGKQDLRLGFVAVALLSAALSWQVAEGARGGLQFAQQVRTEISEGRERLDRAFAGAGVEGVGERRPVLAPTLDFGAGFYLALSGAAGLLVAAVLAKRVG